MSAYLRTVFTKNRQQFQIVEEMQSAECKYNPIDGEEFNNSNQYGPSREKTNIVHNA